MNNTGKKAKLTVLRTLCNPTILYGETIIIPFNNNCYQIEIFEKGTMKVDNDNSNCSNPNFGKNVFSVYDSMDEKRIKFSTGDDGWSGLFRVFSKQPKADTTMSAVVKKYDDTDNPKYFKINLILPRCVSYPTPIPSRASTWIPSQLPSQMPSSNPTSSPTTSPSFQTSQLPSQIPSSNPTSSPSFNTPQIPSSNTTTSCSDVEDAFTVTLANGTEQEKDCEWVKEQKTTWRCTFGNVAVNCPETCDICGGSPPLVPTSSATASPSQMSSYYPTSSQSNSPSYSTSSIPTVASPLPTETPSMDEKVDPSHGVTSTNENTIDQKYNYSFFVTLASSLGGMAVLTTIAVMLMMFARRRRNRKQSRCIECNSVKIDEADFNGNFDIGDVYSSKAENECSSNPSNQEGMQENVVTSELFMSPNVLIPDDSRSFFDASTIQTYSTSVYGKRKIRHLNQNKSKEDQINFRNSQETGGDLELKPIPTEISCENFPFDC